MCQNPLKTGIYILMVALRWGASSCSLPNQSLVWEDFTLYPAPVFMEKLEP